MGKTHNKYKSVKASKEKNKKIGIRSIHDIIHNTPELKFSQKVNYIRHFYTYYDGNTELFYLSDKKTPNSKRFALNKLIIDVINGRKDPNELKAFNKKILEWKKGLDEVKALRQREILTSVPVSAYFDLPIWKREVTNNQDTSYRYIVLIERFLKSEANHLTEKEQQTISYKSLKKLAVSWNNREANKFKD